METAMQRVVGSVDLVTRLKRDILIAEMERWSEKVTEHMVMQSAESSVRCSAKSKCLNDIASLMHEEFRITSTLLNMIHCKRKKAIQEMWGGAGGSGHLNDESCSDLPIINNIPRPMMGMMKCFNWRVNFAVDHQHMVIM